jgi:hypothetical protein
MPRPSLVTSSGPSPVRGFMAAMLVPLPETSSSSKPTALGGHARQSGTRATGIEHIASKPLSRISGPDDQHQSASLGQRARAKPLNSAMWLRYSAAAPIPAGRERSGIL